MKDRLKRINTALALGLTIPPAGTEFYQLSDKEIALLTLLLLQKISA